MGRPKRHAGLPPMPQVCMAKLRILCAEVNALERQAAGEYVPIGKLNGWRVSRPDPAILGTSVEQALMNVSARVGAILRELRQGFGDSNPPDGGPREG